MPSPNTGSPATFIPFPSDPTLLGLVVGTKWGGPLGTGVAVEYSFPDLSSVWSTIQGGDPFGYDATDPNNNNPFASGYRGLDSTQQDAVRNALAAWSHVANISFQEVPDNASHVGDIRVAFTNGGGMDASTYAYTYVPVPPPNNAYAGDVWINPNPPEPSGSDFSLGANGWETVLHELGHAIGLDHPFSISSFPAQLDTLKYTVMSYSDAPVHLDGGDSSLYPTTPMLYDIRALQFLYGANMSWATGDDTYEFHEGGSYYETIWDAGGNDTFKYDSRNGGALIDLRAGNFSQLGDPIHLSNGTIQADDVAIAFNVVIENGIGGGGNDVLIGNAANNVLDGGAGDDTISGGAGDDRLDGQKGTDTLIGGTGNDTFLVGGGDVVVEAPGAGTDTVLSPINFSLAPNIEVLSMSGYARIAVGNAQDNVITGDSQNNTLDGQAGNDTLDGGAGYDTLIGGAGNDTYYVDNAADRVRELAGGGIDTVHSASSYYRLSAEVENLVFDTGSNAQGFGNSSENILTGNTGDDVLAGGLGNDRLIGGYGADTFVFDRAPGAGNIDTIADFGYGADELRFDDASFTALGAQGALAAGAFDSGNFSVAQDADDRLIYNTTTGALYYDDDGVGGHAAVQVALLVGHPGLTAADIEIS